MEKNSNLLTKSIRKANLSWDWGGQKIRRIFQGKSHEQRIPRNHVQARDNKTPWAAASHAGFRPFNALGYTRALEIWDRVGLECLEPRCFRACWFGSPDVLKTPWQGPPQLRSCAVQKSQKCSIFEGFRAQDVTDIRGRKVG